MHISLTKCLVRLLTFGNLELGYVGGEVEGRIGGGWEKKERQESVPKPAVFRKRLHLRVSSRILILPSV